MACVNDSTSCTSGLHACGSRIDIEEHRNKSNVLSILVCDGKERRVKEELQRELATNSGSALDV